MHELSLVKSIFSTLEAEVPSSELDSLSEVELNIGLLANVEPTLLKNAFLAFQETHMQYQGIVLTVHLIPISIRCNICKEESTIENYVFRCKVCGSPSNNIITGEELLIHRVHFDQEQAPRVEEPGNAIG
ncbi:MAG: hydrogenase maturation nickel metallochaperone HypA [Bacteroidota bacterium]